MAFLSLNDDRIAMLIGVVAFSKFWILKIGYKEEFSSFSPGMLLTMETIKYAFDNNLESYEFLGSYESWQDMWPVEIRHYASLMLIPYNLNSLLHFGYTLIGFLKRKINW
jgi:CelD/BcsL family acetyltransferase involved in cellulose biosynthesis